MNNFKFTYFVHHHYDIPALDYVSMTLEGIAKQHAEAKMCIECYSQPALKINGEAESMEAFILGLLEFRFDPDDPEDSQRPFIELSKESIEPVDQAVLNNLIQELIGAA